MFVMLLLSSFLHAQEPTLNGIPTDQETTISIKKGAQGSTKSCARFEVIKGEAQIAGDAELLSKPARAAWKKACEEWKKETKELNADNRVIALNCGIPECGKMPTGESQCSSTATYQVRVRLEE
jgi:hypothetical protein